MNAGLGEAPDPWWWVIVGPDGVVLDSGRQWTRPLAPAAEVAEERIAAWSYPYLCEGRAGELVGVTCRVWRPGDKRPGRASADAWAYRAMAAQELDRLREGGTNAKPRVAAVCRSGV